MGKLVGVAFNEDGVWAVADFSNNCVCMFDDHNQLISKFGSGTKFDAIDGYLLQFGKHGSGDGDLSHPSGFTVHNDSPQDVVVTNNNQVLVADYGNHCISVFLWMRITWARLYYQLLGRIS